MPYILGDLEPGIQELVALKEHLQSCEICQEDFEGCQETIEFVQSHKAEFALAFELLEEPPVISEEELQRSWQGIEAKLEKLEAERKAAKRARIRRIIWRVATGAACLAIGLGVFMVTHGRRSGREGESGQINLLSAKSVTIEEILDDGGSVQLAAGARISTGAQERKTLVINGRHRVLMNGDTSLSIELLQEEGLSGCAVNLALGEIFANVEHDGETFIVGTSHGRAVITGTSFDVKATGSTTQLVVASGTVRFESQKGAVSVVGGQKSTILAQGTPSKPVTCDVDKATAWTFDQAVEAAIAKAKSVGDEASGLADLGPAALSGPVDLDSISFADWVEQKRSWFAREFPQIFQLKEALGKAGVEADYPQLLMQSGDIWRFAYPPASSARITTARAASLTQAASQYGFDQSWLRTHVPAFLSVADAQQGESGLKALEGWAGLFDKARDSYGELDGPTLLNSLHTAVYLANTRALAWLCITHGKYEPAAKDREKLLSALEAEYEAAHKLTNTLIRLLAESQGCPCERYDQLLNDATDGIKTIATAEQGLGNYEIRQ